MAETGAMTPSHPEHERTAEQHFQDSLGHHMAGRLEEAVAGYQQVLQVVPNHLGATIHLARADYQLGRLEEAARVIVHLLARDPQQPDALLLAGFIAQGRGDWDEAVSHFQGALCAVPEDGELWAHLGTAQHASGALQQAVVSYRQSLTYHPDHPKAMANLSLALQELGELEEAITLYRYTLARDPQQPDVWNNLGLALHEQGAWPASEAAYGEALALNPNHVDALANLGRVLEDQGRMVEAEQALRASLALQPGHADRLGNLGGVLKHQARMSEAAACYRQVLAIQPEHRATLSNLLVSMPFMSQFNGEAVLAQARHTGAIFEAPHRSYWPSRHANDPDPERRLKIGYLSPNLARHVLVYSLEPVLAAHDARQVEIYIYAHVPRPDAVTERLRGLVDHWTFVHTLSDDEIAARIVADEIDILIDPMGHWADNRLPVFARKPAPIQIAFQCQGMTSGLSAMDYAIGDRWLNRDGAMQAHATEKIIELEGGFQVTGFDQAPAIGAPPSEQAGCVTLGVFTNPAKLSDRLLHLWAEILTALPTARLLLKGKFLDLPEIQQRLQTRLAEYGVDTARLEILGLVAETEHLALYQRVDLALDTLPFVGGRTSAESLWMGIPTVTLIGETLYGRYTYSHLSRIGAPELAARDGAEYVRIAVALAQDPERLSAYRKRLRPMMQASNLMNPRLHTAEFETALRIAWRRWCRGEEPTSFGTGRARAVQNHINNPVK
ncbi:MAG: tetratricopeptide repeat protein [Magnetococcales bacterium]|nr:tetratricopeptide repeat protein [Magnetococcales bacterium]